MKTEIWKYRVTDKDGEKWECVFDFEVSRERVLQEYYEATGIGLDFVADVEHHKINHYRQDRDACSAIPEVTAETLFSVEQSMLAPEWFQEIAKRFLLDQPILNEYLVVTGKKHGKIAMLIPLVVYRMIESQIEAMQMEEEV
jgi:hypothetical protein